MIGISKKIIPNLCVVFVLICINFKYVKSESNGIESTLDFNRNKNDLITKALMLIPNQDSNSNNSCPIEIEKIENGVKNGEEWAIKRKATSVSNIIFEFQNLRLCSEWLIHFSVIDSWGKLPSAVYSGNFYELGGFSQCFNIQRNHSTYKTQYCLGKLNISDPL